MIENMALLVAFVAGLSSFLLPCVLPLVPVYLATIAGPEIFDTKSKRRRLTISLHSLTFVIGFSMVFSLWGAGAGLIGSAFAAYSSVIRQIAGSLLIVFGLFMLAALKVSWLNYEKRFNSSMSATTGYLRSFLIGGIFCLAWTPCVGPILGGILTLALDSATVWRGACLLGVYSLGLGFPFLLIGVAFDSITPLLRHMYRYTTAIYIFGGVLLIAVGILVLANKLVWF